MLDFRQDIVIISNDEYYCYHRRRRRHHHHRCVGLAFNWILFLAEVYAKKDRCSSTPKLNRIVSINKTESDIIDPQIPTCKTFLSVVSALL